ncbi:MAG: DUF4062 domain-containing protein [Bacteroidales bacterium]|nr:DUF4062 domain-containing protein [Bacteroidales bacterium]
MAKKVFISSPIESLKDAREIVHKMLVKIGFKDIFLSEADRSRDQSSYEVCMREVESSDLYILILGQYYGWIPDGETLSVTELEYDKALKKAIDILVFRIHFFDYELCQENFIRKVESFHTGRFRAKLINGIGELEERILSDIPQHFVDKSEANKKVPLSNPHQSDLIIEFKQSKEIIIEDEINTVNPLLAIKARINYTHEAGNAQLMKLSLNEYELSENDLINKPKIIVLRNGREHACFNINSKCWNLPYSPDFKANYNHLIYKVINADAYINIYSLQNVSLKSKNNILKISHSGGEGNEAYQNPIVIGKCEIIK